MWTQLGQTNELFLLTLLRKSLNSWITKINWFLQTPWNYLLFDFDNQMFIYNYYILEINYSTYKLYELTNFVLTLLHGINHNKYLPHPLIIMIGDRQQYK